MQPREPIDPSSMIFDQRSKSTLVIDKIANERIDESSGGHHEIPPNSTNTWSQLPSNMPEHIHMEKGTLNELKRAVLMNSNKGKSESQNETLQNLKLLKKIQNSLIQTQGYPEHLAQNIDSIDARNLRNFFIQSSLTFNGNNLQSGPTQTFQSGFSGGQAQTSQNAQGMYTLPDGTVQQVSSETSIQQQQPEEMMPPQEEEPTEDDNYQMFKKLPKDSKIKHQMAQILNNYQHFQSQGGVNPGNSLVQGTLNQFNTQVQSNPSSFLAMTNEAGPSKDNAATSGFLSRGMIAGLKGVFLDQTHVEDQQQFMLTEEGEDIQQEQ